MDEKIKIEIIDREASTREQVGQIIKQNCKGYKIVGEADNVINGLKEIKLFQPDVVILGINLPDGSGFDLLDCILQQNFATIFITKHNQYAIKAFKYDAIDYLLKPININDLIDALEKATKYIYYKNPKQRSITNLINGSQQKLSIHSQSETEFIELRAIIRMEAEGCYTNIYLDNKRKVTVTKTLREYENLLVDKKFVRVHNSHIVNMQHVKKFLKKDGYMIEMSDENTIPVAVRRKETFESILKQVAL